MTPLLDAESADRRIQELTAELAAEKDRSAEWANVAKAIGEVCFFRHSGMCVPSCPGRRVCNCENLYLLSPGELPERFRTEVEGG